MRTDQSLAAQLRYAASRGHVDYVRQLIASSGATAFDSDEVSNSIVSYL